jgi:hypothetical protein
MSKKDDAIHGFAAVPELGSLIAGVAAAAAGTGIYYNILVLTTSHKYRLLSCVCGSQGNAFVMDDKKAIINNADLRPGTSIATLFSHDYWGTEMTSGYSHKSYR